MEDDTKLLPSFTASRPSRDGLHDQHQYAHSHHSTPATEFTGFVWPSPQTPGSIDTFSDTHVQRVNHQSLHPLVMPQWPSLLASHSSQTTPVYYPVMQQSLGTTTSTPLLTTSSTESTRPASTPRRTLTDDERRKMCEFHEKNPTAKQNEIGSLFGVERSTVSKVLRHKNKYLQKEDESISSPERRIKLRSPDVEKTLSNWIIREQQKGLTPSDDAIRTKAKHFSSVSSPTDASSANPVTSASWLRNFKRRHNIARKQSNEHLPANRRTPDAKSHDMTSPTTRSPLSSVEAASDSPASSSLHLVRSVESPAPTTSPTTAFANSQRTPATDAVSATLTETSVSSFSPYTFMGVSASPFFTPDSTSASSAGGFYHSAHGIEEMHMDARGPANALHSTVAKASDCLGTDMDVDIEVSKEDVASPTLVMQASALRAGVQSPSREEARQALKVVWRYFRGQERELDRGLDMEETAMIGRFMEKLKQKGEERGSVRG